MTTGRDKFDMLAGITEYHEDMSRSFSKIKELQQGIADKLTPEVLASIDAFLDRSITLHFRFEDMVVFPAVARSTEDARLLKIVYTLQLQHAQVQRQLRTYREIIDGFAKRKVSPDLDSLALSLGELRDHLFPHVELEEKEIVPYVRENRLVRFLMGKKFMELRKFLR